MIKSHFRRFYKHISGENINEKALFLVDSWAIPEDPEMVNLALPSKHVNVLLIPERTTNVHSLKAFFLRQYEMFL
jgi:hypothetical protein